ncbi:MAG: phosphatidylglycerophosphatase A [Betaproteobacteria bacterium]|nr:phosphatidylglycerophosphatase A [Betaproteobacteria bacterium]
MLRPPSLLLSHPAHFLSLGFGSGLAPKAPGTAGTLVAFPLYFLLQGSPLFWVWGAAFVLVGIWACGVTGRALGEHDHGSIVWDEIAAFLLVLPFAPPTLAGYALAFALFRLFDIWKPFPIGWLDARVHGGLGVMLDDLVAALYAVVVLLLAARWM